MILVFLERNGSQFHRMSLETLAAGQQLGRSHESAGRIGSCSAAVRRKSPAGTVYAIEHPLLEAIHAGRLHRSRWSS